MISPSPEEYAYLQVHRQVIGGGGEFLARAREVGERVLGQEYVTSLTQYSLESDETGERLQLSTMEVPVGRPRMEVSSEKDLGVLLLHRGVPAERASRYSLGYHQSRLAANSIVSHQTVPAQGGTGRQRAKLSLSSLTDQLDSISLAGGLDPQASPLVCDHVSLTGGPDNDLLFNLCPRPDSPANWVLLRQSQASHRRLMIQSGRVALPASPWTVSVPFGRVQTRDYDITPSTFTRLVEGLQALTPVRLVMGGVVYSSKDPRSSRR